MLLCTFLSCLFFLLQFLLIIEFNLASELLVRINEKLTVTKHLMFKGFVFAIPFADIDLHISCL